MGGGLSRLDPREVAIMRKAEFKRRMLNSERSEPPKPVVSVPPPPQPSDAVVVTSVTIRLNGHGGYTGTIKGNQWGRGGVYVHGSGGTVGATFKGLLTAIEKGRWLTDKYPD